MFQHAAKSMWLLGSLESVSVSILMLYEKVSYTHASFMSASAQHKIENTISQNVGPSEACK